MVQVKVWNDNVHPFSQEFKGRLVTVPAGEHVVMDYEEAVEFKGMFSPVVLDADENPTPQSYKMIRVERPKQPQVDPNAHLVNHATGQRAANPEELAKMLEMVAHLRISDKDAEHGASSEVVSELKNENLELKARLDALESMIQAQGKPKKGK